MTGFGVSECVAAAGMGVAAGLRVTFSESGFKALLFNVEEDLVARGFTAFSFTTEAADSVVLLVFFDGLLDCMS
jgi:hypothetical protein